MSERGRKSAERVAFMVSRGLKRMGFEAFFRGEELTGPDQELQQMVRHAEVAFEGLFCDDLASVV